MTNLTITPLTPEQLAELKALALEAQALSYAPYSGYHVGAAVLTTGGLMYGGCGNVENSNYTLTKHGEETAVLEAIRVGSISSEGVNFLRAVYLTQALLKGELYECLPCGGCRQFTHQFAAEDAMWVIEQADGVSVKYYSFQEFIPFPYTTP